MKYFFGIIALLCIYVAIEVKGTDTAMSCIVASIFLFMGVYTHIEEKKEKSKTY